MAATLDENEMVIENPFSSSTMSLSIPSNPNNRDYAVSNTGVGTNDTLEHAYRANKTKVRYLIMLHGMQDTTQPYTIPSVLPYQFKIEEYAESGFLIEGRWSSIGHICDENAVPKSIYRSGDTIDNRYFNGGVVDGIVLGLYIFIDKPPERRGDDNIIDNPIFENCTRDKYQYHIKRFDDKTMYSLDQLLNTIRRYHVKNTDNGKLPVTSTINVSIYSCRMYKDATGFHHRGMHSLQKGIDEDDLIQAMIGKLKLSHSKGLSQSSREMEIAWSHTRTPTTLTPASVKMDVDSISTLPLPLSLPSQQSTASASSVRKRRRSRTRSRSRSRSRTRTRTRPRSSSSRSRSSQHSHTRKRRRTTSSRRSSSASSSRSVAHKRIRHG